MEFERPNARACAKSVKSPTLRNIVRFFLLVSTLMASTALSPLKSDAGQANLAWSASASTGVTGYRLYYGTSSGSYTQNVDTGNATNYNVTGLADGQKYYFAAVSYNSAGQQSGYSNEVSYTTPAVTPTAVYAISASAGSGGSISPSGSVAVSQGLNQTFTITPSTGYTIAGVTVDGASVGAVTSYTFSNVSANHTISASYSAQPATPGTVTGTGTTIWPATAVPGVLDSGPDSAVELGLKFRSDSNGYITGIRFYKSSTNTGTHVGNLWTSTGTLLASASFSSETASGWQQVNFSTPVAITANTVYVASYHTNVGHYSNGVSYFASSGTDNPPLHALANGVSGSNGVYAYGATSTFPSQSWSSCNYWVDVVFTPNATAGGSTTPATASDTTPPTASISSPAANATVNGAVTVTASATDNVGVSKVEFYVNGTLSGTDTVTPYNFSWDTASLTNGAYVLMVKAYDAAGNFKQSSNVSVNVSNAVVAPVSSNATIWPATAVPGVVDAGPDSAVELGVKFRSDSNGYITGIRFYKSSTNTGIHVANLWTSTGTLLASATFSGETISGWQQVNFSTPVAITANTVYVASYHTNAGHYSIDQQYFASNGADNAPLHALANGLSGSNGVYAYGSGSIFPNNSWNSSNYWVDVVFRP